MVIGTVTRETAEAVPGCERTGTRRLGAGQGHQDTLVPATRQVLERASYPKQINTEKVCLILFIPNLILKLTHNVYVR